MTKLNKRVSVAAALAGAAMIALTGATAGVAEAKKLPGATKTRSFDEGKVTMRLFDESYTVRRAVTHVPTSREVWVSGKVAVTTSGDVKGGNVRAGYLVGCQLGFGADSGAGVGGEFDFLKLPATPVPDDEILGALDDAFTPNAGVRGGFTLAPGQAVYVPVIKASAGGREADSFNFGAARGGVAYSQERFGVDGCAGHASARAMVTVRVGTPTFKGNITMYGKPFSLG